MSEPCMVAWNAMIDGFRKNGEMGYAILLFESMPKRDVVSWTSVISGFGRNGCGCAVLSLFASVNYVSSFGRNGCSENVISCIGCMVWLLCNQELWYFGCFSAAAMLARRQEYLYLGGLLSSGLSMLIWLHFASSVFGGFAALFKFELYFSFVAVFVHILVIMLKNLAEKNENKKKRKD
ncbi:hypothetical protein TB2_002566 [Malus domestica]